MRKRKQEKLTFSIIEAKKHFSISTTNIPQHVNVSFQGREEANFCSTYTWQKYREWKCRECFWRYEKHYPHIFSIHLFLIIRHFFHISIGVFNEIFCEKNENKLLREQFQVIRDNDALTSFFVLHGLRLLNLILHRKLLFNRTHRFISLGINSRFCNFSSQQCTRKYDIAGSACRHYDSQVLIYVSHNL